MKSQLFEESTAKCFCFFSCVHFWVVSMNLHNKRGSAAHVNKITLETFRVKKMHPFTLHIYMRYIYRVFLKCFIIIYINIVRSFFFWWLLFIFFIASHSARIYFTQSMCLFPLGVRCSTKCSSHIIQRAV